MNTLLVRSPLLLEYSVISDKKLAFYGGMYNRNQKRDILQKWPYIPTSEGIKQKGFGSPTTGRKLIYVPRRGGELRTEKLAPPHPLKKRGKSPYRRSARKKSRFVEARLERERLNL